MSASCCGCGGPETSGASDRRFQSILWVAFAINLPMFEVEIGASFLAGSSALQADALDFLADSANYAISLSVVGLGLAWRTRAAMIKSCPISLRGTRQ